MHIDSGSAKQSADVSKSTGCLVFFFPFFSPKIKKNTWNGLNLIWLTASVPQLVCHFIMKPS